MFCFVSLYGGKINVESFRCIAVCGQILRPFENEEGGAFVQHLLHFFGERGVFGEPVEVGVEHFRACGIHVAQGEAGTGHLGLSAAGQRGHEAPGEGGLAAAEIGEKLGCPVLLKGGHQLNDANDLLWQNGKIRWFNGSRIDNPNTHGTGCTLSSAIAANLAKGYPLEQAVEMAKAYISGALAAMLDLGKGSGPMDHAFDLKPEYRKEYAQ